MEEVKKSGVKEKLHNMRNKILNKILKKADIADTKLISRASMDAIDPQKAKLMAENADLEWEQAVVTDTPVHVAIGRTYKEDSNIQSQTQTKKKAALKMVKDAYERGALNKKAYNLAVRNINEGR